MDLREIKLRLDEQGYAILEDFLDPREAERLDAIARPIMEVPTGQYLGRKRLCQHGRVVKPYPRFGAAVHAPNDSGTP